LNNHKINFLYKAIEDTQATIRAVDVKAGFIFVVIFLPITNLDQIFLIAKKLINISCLYGVLLTPILMLWFVSIYTLFKTVSSISNPSDHISGDKTEGVFYSPSLFPFSFIDNFFNFPIKSNKTIKNYLSILPSNEENIIKELIFEKMKLTYIRDVKIHRLSLCLKSLFIWLNLGLLCWLIYIIKVNN